MSLEGKRHSPRNRICRMVEGGINRSHLGSKLWSESIVWAVYGVRVCLAMRHASQKASIFSLVATSHNMHYQNLSSISL